MGWTCENTALAVAQHMSGLAHTFCRVRMGTVVRDIQRREIQLDPPTLVTPFTAIDRTALLLIGD